AGAVGSNTVTGNASIAAAGAFTAPTGTLTLGANFTNAGTFSANGGTVVFSSSTNHTITPTAATAFNNLTVAESSNNAASSTITFAGNISVTGALSVDGLDTDDKLLLRSSVAGVQRSITLTGTATISATHDFLDIKDNAIIDSST